MILDYSAEVDFSNNKSLRKFRRWLSFRLAKYIAIISERKETEKYFKNSEYRAIGTDYVEAVKNIDLVKHYHYAITEVLKQTKNEGNRKHSNKPAIKKSRIRKSLASKSQRPF